MSGFYQMSGVIKVHTDLEQLRSIFREMNQGEEPACNPVSLIVDTFSEQAGEIEISYCPEMGDVCVSGLQQCGYGSAEECDSILKELAPYVSQPCLVDTVYDGDPGELYIGPEEQRFETLSNATLCEIDARLLYLTPSDLHKVIKAAEFHLTDQP